MGEIHMNPRFQWLIIIVSVVVSVNLIRSLFVLWSRRDIVEERGRVLQTVQKEHAQLVSKRAEVETPQFVEREAREKLGMGKEGETVILMDVTDVAGMNKDDVPLMEPNWKQWWNLFY